MGASMMSSRDNMGKTITKTPFLQSCDGAQGLKLAHAIGATLSEGKSPSRPDSRGVPTHIDFKAVRVRQRALRRKFRGVVRFIMVYFAHMRLLNAAEAIKMFISRLGESDRIKHAMHIYTAKMHKLVAHCGGFVKATRQRHAEMAAVWKAVEDRHLSAHFKAEQRESDEKSRRSSKKSEQKRIPTKDIADELGIVVNPDWWDLRIPVPERNSIIQRYYSAQLLKHVRNEQKII